MSGKAKSKRAKRSPAFNAEEMAILADEVWQHRDILFGGTNGKKSVLAKNRIWHAIAQSMAPSSPCGLRDWAAVRKKWQEFQSQTKKKAARVRQDRMCTGGGSRDDTPLTPEEEMALVIISKTTSEGNEGGIDVLWDQGLSEPSVSGEDEPSGSGAGAAPPTSPAPGTNLADKYAPPRPSSTPVPGRQPVPARHGVRTCSGCSQKPAITTCTCSEMLVDLERETLTVLRGMKDQLKRITALQQEMVNIRREELDLQRRQLALAEAVQSALHVRPNHPSTRFR